AWLTVRSCWDRRLVKEPGEARPSLLRDRVENEEPLGDFLLAVPASGSRTARVATMQVRAFPVTLDLRDLRTGRRHPTRLFAVAMRIERMKHLARTQPDLPATAEFTPAEIEAVIILSKPKGYRRGDIPTVGQIVLWIARQGGYTGKSSGGPPGSIVIGRGMRR